MNTRPSPVGFRCVLLLAALGCGSEPGTAPPRPDVPGLATVALDTPHGDVGALIVTLRGPGLPADADAIAPARPDYEVYSRAIGTEAVRVVLIGDIRAGRGPLFSLQVGAAGRPDAYTVTLDQVATRGNELRDDLTGYRASLSPATQP